MPGRVMLFFIYNSNFIILFQILLIFFTEFINDEDMNYEECHGVGWFRYFKNYIWIYMIDWLCTVAEHSLFGDNLCSHSVLLLQVSSLLI